MNILLVEDDANIAELIAQTLQASGHVVKGFNNAREGLFHAASESFDLLILDRVLPGGVDGIKILETLRSQNNYTPVLFLSGLATVANKVEALKAGGSDYLVKPFAISELLARIEALSRRPLEHLPIK